MIRKSLRLEMALRLLPSLAVASCDSDPVDAGESSSSGTESGSPGTEPSPSDTESGPSDTGDIAVCGNGLVEDDEDCDHAGESALCNDDCTFAACGDGVVNPTAGESCDDGLESPSCDDDCTPPMCGDGVVNEAAGEQCDDPGGAEACNDDCTLATCGDGMLDEAAGEECDDAGESASCDDDCTLASCGDGVTNSTAGEQCDDMGESMTCNVDCSAAMCGDGIVNMAAGEECDDAGESVACDADCTPPTCGDGVVNAAAGEACDDAGESAACNDDCTAQACGDGIINMAAGEECDDAGESAACDVDCTLPLCGDGVFNALAGEACDGGGRTAACNADCTLASCGDGITNMAAGEACDDAGESATCNADCSAAMCGDGITNVTAGEICDDMGESASCDVDCTLPACGDGLANTTAGEDCDDAGETAACDIDCTLPVCGDGLINVLAGEVCEGADLAGVTCELLGFNSGDVSCDATCAIDESACSMLPATPVLTLGWSQVKQFDFSWAPAYGADYYQLEQRVAPGDPFLPLGGDIFAESISFTMPLHFRFEASYVLRACNAFGCSDSTSVDVMSSLAEAVGYIKASNTGALDNFGDHVAVSADGQTVAVSAPQEDSIATGVDGNQANGSNLTGAVYVFVNQGAGQWAQQAYIKASNTGNGDGFGSGMALSDDGSTLAVGAIGEDSNATGIDGDQADGSAASAGAVYVFVRDGMAQWSQQAYVKASNTNADDRFGEGLALSGDGDTLAVGAVREDSNAAGINGDQANNALSSSGAAYVFARDGMGQWSQQAYVKSPVPRVGSRFGQSLALDVDGDTLAVGSPLEDSNATGIDGDPTNLGASSSGAVFVFSRDGGGAWSQQAYVKASNTGASDQFGTSVALSDDGDTLAVGANLEDSGATGVGGNQADDSITQSGAAYVFARDGMSQWSQQAYIKSTNTGANDYFGFALALSGDGDTLAVGSPFEDSNAVGLAGDQANNLANQSGAAYVFVRDGMGTWSPHVYVKSPNTEPSDVFGIHLGLDGDGGTLVVGGYLEGSGATGVGGNQADNSANSAGAVYLY